jgi:hypothetical protein
VSTSLQGWRQPLSYLAAAALLAGIYARFKGLDSAPLAVDEYYLARSIENVLHTGIPAFNCGGLYMRGVLLQYSAAAMQASGFSAEFAARFISALSGLLCIPAVFILGDRVHGRVVGLLAVIVVALSVWEIEMARFGRMYAPFQAVFLWYLVFFLRYTVDRDARALWPMIVLSIVGPLVWEAGVFLPLANLLSLFLQRWPDRLQPRDWTYLVSCSALLALALTLWFLMSDLIGNNSFIGYTAESWPLGYDRSMSLVPADPLTTLRLPLIAFSQHLWLIAAAIIPLAATLWALRWIWQLRSQRFLAAGLLVMLTAAVAHQFLAVTVIGLSLLLTRVASWQMLLSRQSAPLQVAVVACGLFWLAFGVVFVDWRGAGADGLARRAAMLTYQFLRFPDFIAVVIRPWARAVPRLGVGLLLGISVAIYRAARYKGTPNYERILLLMFVVLLLAVSASHQPREETRYVFFLYPVAIIVALTTIARAAASLARPRAIATGITSAVALGGFALSEDFQPHHLRYIDSPTETFRAGMSAAMQSHLVIREDYRAMSLWLQQHRSGQDIVINGVHGLDDYYSGINYFYVDQRSPNFPKWSCSHGTVERWGNYPLLYSIDSLTSLLPPNTTAYLVAFVYDREQLLLSLAALHPQVVMSEGDTIILKLQG